MMTAPSHALAPVGHAMLGRAVLFCACVGVAATGASNQGVEPREVLLPVPGGRVVASLYGEGTHGVVLAHGAVFDKESWGPLASELASRGHRALAIDFRAFGRGRTRRARALPRDDVLAAVQFLRNGGVRSLSLVGASAGAVAVARAVLDPAAGEIARLVLLAPPEIPAPERLPGRKLLVISRDEALAPRLRVLFAKLADPKRLVELPGRAHAQHVFRTEQAARLAELIRSFLEPEI